MQKLIFILMLVFSTLVHANDSESTDYLLGPNDLIQITVYGSVDLTRESRISPRGNISFPWLGEINVDGITTTQLEQKIASGLIDKKIIFNPQVSVSITDYQSKTYLILGNIVKPGKYPLNNVTSLTAALAIAGGAMPTASDVVTVISHKNGESIKNSYDLRNFFTDGDGASNPKIAVDDEIYVSKSPVFYIYGEVQKPGPFILERNMTTIQALAVAGGLTLRGTQRDIKVIRKDSKGKNVTLTVSPDDAVQVNDVLYIKESLF